MKAVVWQLIDSSSVGGIETHVVHLSRELTAMAVTNQIVQIKSYGMHPVFDATENRDISYRCCQGIADVIKQCRQEKPTVIHAHGTKACLIAKYLRLTTRQKIVCTYHTGETGVGLQGLYDRLNQWTAFIGKSIAVSDPIASKLLGDNLRIDNFIPIPECTNTDRKKTIAFVGRLSYEKGPDRFLEVAHLRPDLQFAMYGAGPMLDKLKRAAPDNLQLHTGISSMDQHWQDIELLCITSREEGLPLVALEAMARGICVVSFPVGGIPTLIQNCVNGFLLESQSVVELNTFIQNYVRMAEHDKSKVRTNARLCIQQEYSSQSLVPHIKRIYQVVSEGEL